MTEPIVSPRLFTVREAAVLLGIGRSTLHKRINERSVPFRRLSERRIGFTQTDIDEIIAASLQPAVIRR